MANLQLDLGIKTPEHGAPRSYNKKQAEKGHPAPAQLRAAGVALLALLRGRKVGPPTLVTLPTP